MTSKNTQLKHDDSNHRFSETRSYASTDTRSTCNNVTLDIHTFTLRGPPERFGRLEDQIHNGKLGPEGYGIDIGPLDKSSMRFPEPLLDHWVPYTAGIGPHGPFDRLFVIRKAFFNDPVILTSQAYLTELESRLEEAELDTAPGYWVVEGFQRSVYPNPENGRCSKVSTALLLKRVVDTEESA